MFVRTVFMSLLAAGVNGQATCNGGGSPLRDIYGAAVSCGQGMMPPPPPPGPLPTDSISYATQAGAGDLFEIQSGQIALQKGSIDARNFGQMLITDHTQTTNTLKAAAASVGLYLPPPALNSMQQQMINQLQLASPANFDSIFWPQQVTAHKMALDLNTNYATYGDTPAIRAAASAAIPIVQMHLSTAQAKVAMMGSMMGSMMGASCPANFYCQNAVCCSSQVYSPSVSLSSPYFSASVYPQYSAPLYQPVYQPVYQPLYQPLYYNVAF